jgi:hypothetical protein
MTFLEAAIELLKQERKPLHYSKLSELAIKRDLLDHVGRDPETAMQTALANAIKKGVPDLLVRVKPGVFGLRHYPAPAHDKPEKPQKQEAAAGEKKEKAKKSRSRRGGKKGKAAAAAEAAAPVEAASETPSEPVTTVAAEAAPVEAAQQPLLSGSESEAPVAAAEAPKTFHMPDDDEEEEDEAPPAATPGAPVFSASPNGATQQLGFGDERRGRRRRRRRRGRGGGEFGMPGGTPGGMPQPMQGGAMPQQQPYTPPPLPPPPPSTTPTGERVFGLADAAYEILRNQQDGRPMHVKQITDMAISRKLIKPDGHDLWRSVRVSLQQEIRERIAQGLRPRIRFAGGALFAAADRRVDPELLGVERQMAERLEALRKATRQGMVRRLSRLTTPAFETVAKLLLERLGYGGLETVKRTTEGLYLAVSQPRSGPEARTLVSIRAGAEQGRRAVGELRAGVQAKAMSDGLLVTSGRLLPDASQEAGTAGPPVELWDGEHVAGDMLKLGIGLTRTVMPIEYLDADFFADISET